MYIEEEVGLLLGFGDGFIIGWSIFGFVETADKHLLLVLVALLLLLHAISYNKYIPL
jgi:hypothetical protein